MWPSGQRSSSSMQLILNPYCMPFIPLHRTLPPSALQGTVTPLLKQSGSDSGAASQFSCMASHICLNTSSLQMLHVASCWHEPLLNQYAQPKHLQCPRSPLLAPLASASAFLMSVAQQLGLPISFPYQSLSSSAFDLKIS